MGFYRLLIGLVNLLLVIACVVGTWNAVKLHSDVRKVVKYRGGRLAPSSSDPLAIFSPSEIEKLSVSPARSKVVFTRTPDPWSDDFCVDSHLLAVHANRLRDLSQIAKLFADMTLVVGTAAFGVAAGRLSRDAHFLDSATITMLVALLAVLLALIVNLTIVPAWRAAADKYRARVFSPVVPQGLLTLEENQCGSEILLPEAVVNRSRWQE